MCLHPQFIPNPNYKAKKQGLNVLKDCSSQFIPVPCGHCPQCIAMRQSAVVQRVYMESINNYLYFVTLTYNNESLPVFSIHDFEIPFADYSDVQKMFKRIRKGNLFGRPFKYFAVSEFGSKGRPHFHLIVSIPKLKVDDDYTPFNIETRLYNVILSQWCRNVGSKRNPDYKEITTLVRKFRSGRLTTNFDCHYIVPNLTDSGVSSTAYYVSKYMMKPSTREVKLQQALKLNLPIDEFESIWKDIKNGHYMSKGFGLRGYSDLSHNDSCGFDISIGAYIRKCINQSIQDGLAFPCFIIPDSGKMIPLSRFYRKHYLYVDDAYSFYYNQPDQTNIDSLFETKSYENPRYDEEVRQFNKRCNIVDSSDISEYV